jgi:hypothetical protein
VVEELDTEIHYFRSLSRNSPGAHLRDFEAYSTTRRPQINTGNGQGIATNEYDTKCQKSTQDYLHQRAQTQNDIKSSTLTVPGWDQEYPRGCIPSSPGILSRHSAQDWSSNEVPLRSQDPKYFPKNPLLKKSFIGHSTKVM